MTTPLKYLSVAAISELRKSIKKNLNRYLSGDFKDIIRMSGASIALSLEYDPKPFSDLIPASSADVSNAMLVWRALPGMTASLATEDRIWTRLSHMDCLEYARGRWLAGLPESKLERAIENHMFADTLTRYRDDNAVSRLWWCAYIAKQAWPEDQEAAVKLIMSKTDIRANFIERPLINSRPEIAAAILRAMHREPWVTEQENNFRDFMKTINKYGGGMLFEAVNQIETDKFVSRCLEKARSHR